VNDLSAVKTCELNYDMRENACIYIVLIGACRGKWLRLKPIEIL